MNERGSVTIDSEIRDVLGLDGKKALLRLTDIQVVKIEDEDIDIKDLPDETCQTISWINDRGVVRINEEVREVMGINGRTAMLKIGGIEVAKLIEEEITAHSSISPVGVTSWHATAAASWVQTKSIFMADNPEIKYPPSWSTATRMIGSWVLIAATAVVVLRQTDAFEGLATGDPVEWAGLTIALAFGTIVMVLSLPDQEETVRKLAKTASE